MIDLEWVEIGKIVAPHGIKGQVRVYPESDFPERFVVPGQRWLRRLGETEPRAIYLEAGQYLPGKGLYLVRLAGVGDRHQAEALRGSCLLVPMGDRPPLGEEEYHVLDLIGLEVFDQNTQALVGTVIDVLTAGNDLLEVRLTAHDTEAIQVSAGGDPSESGLRGDRPKKPPKSALIPFVRAIVPIVDLEQRRIEITPPPGLVDKVDSAG